MSSLKRTIYETLETRSSLSKRAILVQSLLAILIVSSSILSIWETVPSNDIETNSILDIFQNVCGFIFTIEYLLRIWAVSVQKNGLGAFKARLKLISKPTMILDLAVILPFVLPFMFNFDVTAVRVLRLIRIMRFARFGRFSKSLNLLLSVIRNCLPELAVSIALSLALLIISATGIYHFEKDAQPEVFTSIPHSTWWAINILTGISFGDYYPLTLGGKIFAGIISLLGVGTIALPAGIIASGILESINRKKKVTAECPHCHKVISNIKNAS